MYMEKIFTKETTFDKIELPNELYKYRSWYDPLHKRMITHNEIYFAAPLEASEQDEFNLEKDFSLLTKNMVFKYSLQIAKRKNLNRRLTRKDARDLTKKALIFDSARQQEFKEYFRQELNKVFSVYCLSQHKNIYRLWNTFALDQEVFCVGFNTRQMFDNVEISGSGGLIMYYSEANKPKLRPICLTDEERIEDMLKMIYSLPEKFRAEEEYRLAKIFMKNRQVTLNKGAFKEIILGDQMPNNHKDELISAARQNLPDAEIYQAECNYDTGGYIFNRL